MAAVIRTVHWTEQLLLKSGIGITTRFVFEALNNWWQRYSDDDTITQRHFRLPLSNPAVSGREDEISAAVVGAFEGVKTIAKGQDSGGDGLRVLDAHFLLKQACSGARCMSLDCRNISLATKGWIAATGMRLLPCEVKPIRIFVFGAGEIAEWVVRFLYEGCGNSIGEIAIYGSNATGDALVDRLSSMMGTCLVAVRDKSRLKAADYVINTNDDVGCPFSAGELAARAVILLFNPLNAERECANRHQSCPSAARSVIGGAGDDVGSVRLAYSNKGTTFAARGIRNVTKVLNDPFSRAQVNAREGRVTIRAADTTILDVIVVGRVFEMLTETVARIRNDDARFDEHVKVLENESM